MKSIAIFLKLFLLNVCFLGNLPFVWAQLKDPVHQLDSLINYYYESKQFSGSVLVAEGGAVIYDEHFGFQDIAETQKIGPETVFEIASLSKAFSAVLVLKLVEAGKVELDQPLSNYLSGFPYPEISIRHILSHTSGLSERTFFAWAAKNMSLQETYTNEFILDYLIQEHPALSFAPGEAWEYSNLAYFLLPLLIEEMSSTPFITFLQEEILHPLEMNYSGIYSQEFKGKQMQNYAFGKIYQTDDESFRSAFGLAKSDSIYGSVGMLSNTSDLFIWDRALRSDLLLGSDLLEEAFTATKLKDGSSTHYGLGWFVHEAEEGDGRGKRVDHYGLWPGYESSIVRYIDRDICLIILSNQSPSAKDQLIKEISEILF